MHCQGIREQYQKEGVVIPQYSLVSGLKNPLLTFRHFCGIVLYTLLKIIWKLVYERSEFYDFLSGTSAELDRFEAAD